MARVSDLSLKTCNSLWEKDKCCLQAFSSFATVFLKALLTDKAIKIWDCLVKGNSLAIDKILDWSKLRAFADDKVNVT